MRTDDVCGKRGSRMRFFYMFGLVLTVEGRAERSVCSCTVGTAEKSCTGDALLYQETKGLRVFQLTDITDQFRWDTGVGWRHRTRNRPAALCFHLLKLAVSAHRSDSRDPTTHQMVRCKQWGRYGDRPFGRQCATLL